MILDDVKSCECCEYFSHTTNKCGKHDIEIDYPELRVCPDHEFRD